MLQSVVDSGLVCESVPASDLGQWELDWDLTRWGWGCWGWAGLGLSWAEAGTVGAEMAGGGAEAGARAEARMELEAEVRMGTELRGSWRQGLGLEPELEKRLWL